ncbi:unnamed protein product, partial [Acanthoscelides obtectus]
KPATPPQPSSSDEEEQSELGGSKEDISDVEGYERKVLQMKALGDVKAFQVGDFVLVKFYTTTSTMYYVGLCLELGGAQTTTISIQKPKYKEPPSEDPRRGLRARKKYSKLCTIGTCEMNVGKTGKSESLNEREPHPLLRACAVLHNISIEDSLHDFEVPPAPEAHNEVIVGQAGRDAGNENQDEQTGISKRNETLKTYPKPTFLLMLDNARPQTAQII